MKSAKTLRGATRLTFGLLYLSLAIFAWGLQYKLSLYQAGDNTAPIPAAKLWAGRSEASDQKASTVQLERPQAVAEFSLLLFVLVMLGTADLSIGRALLGRCRFAHLWRLRVMASLHPFFFRPPPQPALLLP